jgi:hypothetical protein
VIHYFTHADKGIFQLLKALVTQTGTVAREFVSGKRKKYFPPFNFFLIVAALFVFMGSILPNKSVDTPYNHYRNSYQKKPVAEASTTSYSSAQKQINVAGFLESIQIL